MLWNWLFLLLVLMSVRSLFCGTVVDTDLFEGLLRVPQADLVNFMVEVV